MTVRMTSLAAFDEVQLSMGEKQRAVLDVLTRARRPVCNQEIAKFLGWPINTVTPRVKELREQGLVVEADRAVYAPTNRRVIRWKAVEG